MLNRLFLVALLFMIAGLSARADIIYIRGRDKVTATVKSEDAKNVVITDAKKKKDETVPSADVLEIVYDNISPASLSLLGGAYRAAKDAEKAAETDDPAARKKALTSAIDNYKQTLTDMKRDTKAQQNVARHLEYKVAALSLKLASDRASVDQAVSKLQTFARQHADSWQINLVMPMIAQVQMDNREYKEAEKTFQEMAEMAVFSPEVRTEAELMVVTVAVRAGNIEAANKKLDALEKKPGSTPAFKSRVKMARAEVLVGLKQFDKAIPILRDILKTTTDKATKAAAHNTFGETLFKQGNYTEARWEFLWVDTIYNQDRNQHAKALYFLWKTFEQLNQAERAQECRETLLNDRQFTGTEYQKMALSQK